MANNKCDIFKFPFIKQKYSNDCGLACLRSISFFYGKRLFFQNLKDYNILDKNGISLLSLIKLAEMVGFESLAIKIRYQQLQNEIPIPCIILWKQKHFVVLYKIINDLVYISDPSKGLLNYKKIEFIKNWIGSSEHKFKKGFVLC